MVWGVFAREQKSQLEFMPKTRFIAEDFVEMVYNDKLINFLDIVLEGVDMEDGTSIHHNKACESPPTRKAQLACKLSRSQFNWECLEDANRCYATCQEMPQKLKSCADSSWKRVEFGQSYKAPSSMSLYALKLQAIIDANRRHTRWYI